MAISSDVSDVPKELQDEKGKGMMIIAGAFMALLGGLETLTYIGAVVPHNAEMASAIHTLFIGSVASVTAFWFKSRR